MKPLAIVTPWFGSDLKGGAEQQAWQVATRLAERGHPVEVLTTCCRSFQDDWAVNHLKAGVCQEQGIKIRRFRVERRDRDAFGQVNHIMLSLPASRLKPGVNPVTLKDAKIFCSENIHSPQLLNYLKNQQNQYQAFLFLPYLYGPILNGLPLVASRAFLQPCLHNESYAYLPQVANIFYAAQGLLFISEGEAQLARHLYGPGLISKSIVAGAGVEAGQHYDETISQIEELSIKQELFVLYLGRRDRTKNTDLLVRAYAAFKQKHPASRLRLVLAGPGTTSYNGLAPDLIDLGLVAESEKEALLANCLALLQPSQNESYSRVMMEAWFYRRPVAVHRDCLATAMAVESAQGGWLARTEDEWVQLFGEIDQSSKEHLAKYGTNGQAYAKENAAWNKVIERYETALGLSKKSAFVASEHRGSKLKEIHQLLPNLAYGDAISNHALAIRNYLRRCGYKSDIFVKYVDEKVAHEPMIFDSKHIDHQAGLIYHHSIGSELTDYAIAHPESKCLIYHNITPAEFFLPFRPEFAKLLEKGRAELKQLAQHFPLSVGDSTYNASELAASGFPQPGVLPIAVDPKKWDMAADAALMQQLQDGKTNLLFVGRLAPNKRQEHLLEAFAHYLTMEQEARLILVGYGDVSDPYYCHLLNIIQSLGLTRDVMLTRQVNDAQLLAFYRTAHLLWSMSEHEGFCVPIVEAMWFDIPVLAYKSSAVPETLGEAGLMFTRKDDLVSVAALAKILVRDETLRSKVIKAQRQRRESFTQAVVNTSLNGIVSKMEETYYQ
ncbi:MAG: glycosyltransferase family 4 protein [Microcoleus sp. SIO2G3]|nr:glycosyltransferase family 4 protein [Microcoleus sp. SIO2G3]